MPEAVVCMASDLSADGVGDDTVIGPVAEDVIARTRAPVLLLGPACTVDRSMARRRLALVCADGSAAASTIEPVVAEWATALDLDVQLLTVMDAGQPHLAGIPTERVLREIDSLAFRLQRRGLTVTSEILENGVDPAFAINRFAEYHPATLIASSARGHRHDLHVVLGDTVQRLVRRSIVPVLVTRPTSAGLHA